ncbi:MAG: hypothetical protein WCJ84_04695 [Candidatus Peregrinibacteria bacterium]
MAVPKKKKSSSATKRQRNAYVVSQHKKLLGFADRSLRNAKGRAVVDAEKVLKSHENVTVVQA